MLDYLKREIITTADGSTTIHLPDWNEQYHSKHGAINEAKHVFIDKGLRHLVNQNKSDKLSILEIGFGTGLNAFMTYLETQLTGLPINYIGVEAYPVQIEEAKLMNYPKAVGVEDQTEAFDKIHQIPWETMTMISDSFTLTKRQQFFKDIDDSDNTDLIYFDAFGARVQPELWTVSIFEKMYRALKENGVLVTYAAKGSVRRAMQEVGFSVERLPGPPGKREMLRATKSKL